ncbi:MAG: hypothetical protein F4231_04110 [Acidimicrobiaceae bacterium]|nr:hypothetical protein [Acidimicrobiaceae bacterium]
MCSGHRRLFRLPPGSRSLQPHTMPLM